MVDALNLGFNFWNKSIGSSPIIDIFFYYFFFLNLFYNK